MVKFDFNSTDDTPTRDLYIPAILSRSDCPIHGAGFNEPCYNYPWVDDTCSDTTGICNSRAKSAGMTGRISETSLDRSILKKPRR